MASRVRALPGKYNNADYGKGAHQIDTPDYMFSPQAMIAYLRQTLASPSYRAPVLPAVAIELMRLTRLPQLRVAEVRQVLERDSLLAAKKLGQRIHPMAAVLCVADWIAARAGTAIGSESESERAEQAARHLGFSQQILDNLEARAKELLELHDAAPASRS